MIKANDLRVNNLILNRNGDIDIVTDKIFQDFRYPRMDGNFGYSGVSICKKILIQFGFCEKYPLGDDSTDEEYNFRIFKKGDFEILVDMSHGTFTLQNIVNLRLIEYRYAHELQNLYFAICGEELVFSSACC